jgi:hypothetical protein
LHTADIMIEISKWPAVIFTSYRTGSTSFGFKLVNQNPGTIFFNEPAYHGGIEMEQFTQMFDASNYLVKVMGDTVIKPSWEVPQHPAYQTEQMMSDRFYKIKLCRRDEVRQIASYYLARVREQWSYYNTEADNPEYLKPVEINLALLKRAIAIIKYNNEVIDTIDSDVTVYYEDLTNFDDNFKLTPKPSNYDDLLGITKSFCSIHSSRA